MRFLGTTWEKIEGRFLLSTSGSGGSGQLGGSNTKTISKANLPAVKLQVDSFSLTNAKHSHGINTWRNDTGNCHAIGNSYRHMGNNTVTERDIQGWIADSGGQNTGTAAPYTSALGSGTPLDITPAYYTVHIWKRLT